MVFEVDEEPLPTGWEVAMSRSKQRPYYFNAKTQKVYWVDDDIPRGWSHQYDTEGRKFYFHIKNKNDTITYEKPVLRTKPSDALPISPEPLPVPEPTYGNNQQEEERNRRYSDDRGEWRASNASSKGSSSPLSTYERKYSDTGSQNEQQQSPRPYVTVPPRMERKKSNSLMDLLSPGPPASGAVDRPQEYESPRLRSASSSTMDIANLVTSNNTPSYTAPVTGKRPFDQISKETDPDAAADFYNNLKRNATSDRADSMLFHMRAMNNWVKSILISDFSKRDDRVLDLACGKGGDLMKWAKRGISQYVGVDIAQKSLEDAVERFSSNTQHQNLDVQFIQGDLGRVSLLNDSLRCWSRERGWHDAVPMEEPGYFQIISMQFSFHYMFGEEQRASRFFRTLHELLADGGIFIATTVDPNKILLKYFASLDNEKEKGPRDADIRICDKKKREVCTIRFDETIRPQLSGYHANPEGSFGLRYNFTLRDNTDDDSGGGEAVDLPEYLVPDDLLRRMLKENGFELLLKQNFHQFILKNTDKHRSLLEKMHVMNYQGTISDAEWEIAGLYQVLAFKKAY